MHFWILEEREDSVVPTCVDIFSLIVEYTATTITTGFYVSQDTGIRSQGISYGGTASKGSRPMLKGLSSENDIEGYFIGKSVLISKI